MKTFLRQHKHVFLVLNAGALGICILPDVTRVQRFLPVVRGGILIVEQIADASAVKYTAEQKPEQKPGILLVRRIQNITPFIAKLEK